MSISAESFQLFDRAYQNPTTYTFEYFYPFSLCYLGDGVILAGGFDDTYDHNGASLYRSTDYGITWASLGKPFDNIYNLIYIGNRTILASSDYGHIWRSTDSGISWVDLGTPYDIQYICGFACGRDLIAIGSTSSEPMTTFGEFLQGTGYGIDWSGGMLSAPLYLGPLIPMCVACSENGNIIVIGAGDNHILRSLDAGGSWADLGQIADIRSIVYLGNGVFLGSAPDHIWRSTDWGNTWVDQYTICYTINTINFCYLGEGVVICGRMISRDYGITWIECAVCPSNMIYIGNQICLGITNVGGAGSHNILRYAPEEIVGDSLPTGITLPAPLNQVNTINDIQLTQRAIQTFTSTDPISYPIVVTGTVAIQNGFVTFYNEVGSYDVTIAHQNNGSITINRFNNQNGVDLVLEQGDQVNYYYNNVAGYWQQLPVIRANLSQLPSPSPAPEPEP